MATLALGGVVLDVFRGHVKTARQDEALPIPVLAGRHPQEGFPFKGFEFRPSAAPSAESWQDK